MAPGNVVLEWNNIYLDLVRKIGGAPGPLSRIGALMHLAMYEAVTRLTATSPYPRHLRDSDIKDPKTNQVVMPGNAVANTTAAYAACHILTKAVEVYVSASKRAQGEVLNPFDPFQVRPGADSSSPALEVHTTDANAQASEAYGKAIAYALLAKYNPAEGLSPAVTLKPDQKGEWRDTGSGPALTPNWGEVDLFLLPPPVQDYLPTVIPNDLNNYEDLLESSMYAMQLAEVKLLGEANSTARTREQTEIAIFWANDLNGTSKPPGQLYTITQTVAQQQGTLVDVQNSSGNPTGNGLLETARLFAMVGTAMVNASIVAWKAKYFWPNKNQPLRLWRPETAIQRANEDGNPSTAADATWQPLSAMLSGMRFSPNFPAYVSGHSTFAAAHAAAMRAFFGRDTIAFTATTEDPHALRDENGIRRTRRFSSFTQAALENGRSRVYLGVHYQFDANGGYEIGTLVGEHTADLFEATVQTPAPSVMA
ncbi:vanadium-dependent haloperoxidase [Hymenobacter sp. BT507]|uniref:Vanadium-dependent haloperoxidase n=1 Tax=Hymenobacter citatus TaxID=2763506 RepID=A0ABR7MHB0_9BACT|nr:vanadium-dependent haloperoxidase [Hymenobacter citatus]MBC6610455.1 vanadium-dependent haloperoxidase [Hymenobacter citatus]